MMLVYFENKSFGPQSHFTGFVQRLSMINPFSVNSHLLYVFSHLAASTFSYPFQDAIFFEFGCILVVHNTRKKRAICLLMM